MLEAHGDTIVADHESIGALSVLVHAEDLPALIERDDVFTISADARVRSSDLLGGLSGTLTNLVDIVGEAAGGLLRTVGNILDPGTDPVGAPVPPRVVRETLGLDPAWKGSGVGVAKLKRIECSSGLAA